MMIMSISTIIPTPSISVKPTGGTIPDVVVLVGLGVVV
jgi:hypothetical protein